MVAPRVLRRVILLLVAGIVAACIAGCGGGGASVPAPGISASQRPATTAGPTTSVGFILTVPPRTAQAKSRKPAYISVNTQSVIITLVSVNGTPYTGTPAEIATNLTPSNPACTSTSGTLTCTVSAPGVAGNDSFSVNTYDAQQSSAQPATPAGDLLSTGTFPLTVVAGQANTPSTPLVLNGIAASFSATFASNAHLSGSGTSGFTIIGNQPYTLTFTAADASGATIIGPGTPTLTSSSSALAITPVNADTYTVQVKAYSATPLTATVSPSTGSSTLSFTTVQELWVTDPGANTLTGYAIGTGSYTNIPADTMSGLSAPWGIAFDAGAHLWMAQGGSNTVSEYTPGSSTAMATITAGINGPGGIRFDAAGHLWVANNNTVVTEYTPADNAPVAFQLTDQMNIPNDVAFDANGNVWVANVGDIVYEYAPGSDHVIGSITDTSPLGLAFDANGDLWVSEANTPGIDKFVPPLNGQTYFTKSASITSGVSFPQGLAFDAHGNLYDANSGAGNVLGFLPVDNATPIAGTPIIGSEPGFVAVAP